MNYFQSYIRHYFESPLVIYEVSCQFLWSKIQLVSSSCSLLQMFLSNLGKKFSHSKHFVKNRKDENHLMQVLRNMVNGVEQTSLHPIFFLLNAALHYQKAQCFSYWWVSGVFFEDFHTHVAAVESKSLHWVSDCGLRNSKWIIQTWSCHTLSIIFFHKALPLG